MSFQVPVVGGEVTGHEPEEFAENSYSYETNPTQAVTHLMGVKDNKLRRIPSNIIRWAAYKITQVWNYAKTATVLTVSADGDLVMGCTREWTLGSSAGNRPTHIKLNTSGNFILYNLAQLLVYNHIKTYPDGTGLKVYADEFVVYSSAALKTNVADLPDSKPIVDALTAKQYTLTDGKTYFGFIADNVPAECRSEYQDESGKTYYGISQGAMIAFLTDYIRKQDARLTALESRVK